MLLFFAIAMLSLLALLFQADVAKSPDTVSKEGQRLYSYGMGIVWREVNEHNWL